MKSIRAIVQKHPSGCGIACVAFIFGLSYPVTLKLFKNGEKKANNCGFYCKEIIEVLNNKNWNFKYRYIKPRIRRKIYQNYSIVFIKRSKTFPTGHYLCRHKNLWMDPWINFKENQDIKEARAGFRKKLPGKPIYVIFNKTK